MPPPPTRTRPDLRILFSSVAAILAASILLGASLSLALPQVDDDRGRHAPSSSLSPFADPKTVRLRVSDEQEAPPPPPPHSRDNGGGGGSSSPIHFFTHSQAFVDAIVRCLQEEECRIVFHHVNKTGGTTIERTFFRLYPGVWYSCCDDELLEKLTLRPELKQKKCEAKFSSYQVFGRHIEGIVNSCMDINSKNGNRNSSGTATSVAAPRPPRTVVLTSFREPIARTLSSIHQQCNKYIKKRSERTISACTRCDYGADASFWDHFVKKTIKEYDEILNEVLPLGNIMKNVQVLSIDVKDIDAFIQQFMATKMMKTKKSGSSLRENEEQKWLCNFKMPSEMIKSLDKAELTYRNLTLS